MMGCQGYGDSGSKELGAVLNLLTRVGRSIPSIAPSACSFSHLSTKYLAWLNSILAVWSADPCSSDRQ